MDIKTFEILLEALNKAYEEEGGIHENEGGKIVVQFFFPKEGGKPRNLKDIREVWELPDGRIRRLSISFEYEAIGVNELREEWIRVIRKKFLGDDLV